jgi:16S rRNA (guanine527-N7)-methyltransferase
MKGLHPDEEIARLPSTWKVEKVIRLDIPQLEASRHLVFLQHISITAPN